MKHDTALGRQADPGAATGYAAFDETERLIDMNPAICGLSADACSGLLGSSWLDVMKRIARQFDSIDGASVKRSKKYLEDLWRLWTARDGTPIEALSKKGNWKLLSSHPRPGGGVVLISVDNSARKRQQSELDENEDIYRCITESHPLPVWMADEETGEILYESIEASRMLGRPWGDNASQFIIDHYVDPADRTEVRRLLDERGILRDHLVRFKTADGKRIWISANVRRATFKGRNTLIAGIVDVTARKEREDQLAKMITNHPLPVAMNEIDSGKMLVQSPAAAQMFGRDPNSGEQVYTTDYYVNPEDRVRLIRKLRKHGKVDNFEALWKRPDNSQFWVKINLRLVEFEGREVVLAGVLDLTEQKQREHELTSARELLQDAINSMNEGFALYNEDARLVMCNAAYRKMNDVAADILKPGMRWEQLLRVCVYRGAHPEAIGNEEAWLEKQFENRAKYRQKQEFQHADGRWSSVSFHKTRLGGFVVTRSDVTERYEREAARRETEEIVKQVVEACPAALEMRRIDNGQFLYRSPAAQVLLGERKNLAATYVNRQDQVDLHASLAKYRAVYDRRMQLINADGEPFWASVSARYIEFRGNLVIVSTISDLTERVEIEQGFRRASELLTDAIESLSEGFALYDANQRLVMCNRQFLAMNECTADILKPGVSLWEYLETGVARGQFPDAVGNEKAWLEKRRKGYRTNNSGFEFQQSDGHWYSASNRLTREGGFVVTRTDITERRKMEQAQREADEIVRQVIDVCPVALEMRDLDTGACLFRSPGAADLLGEREHPVESYVNPNDRTLSLDLLERTGEVRNRRLQLKRGDGEPFWASVSARASEFRDRKVVVSTVSDLTEQIALEEERTRASDLLVDAIESLSEGFALYDKDMRLVMCNSRYLDMNAPTRDLLKPGHNWEEFLRAGVERGQFAVAAGREEQWIGERVKRIVENNRAYVFQQSDGRWYSAVSSATREGGFVVTRVDITKQKQMEEAEREADALVRQVLEACPVMIMMNELDSGDVIYRNPTTIAVLGERESVRAHYADLADRERYVDALKKKGFIDNFEYLAQRQDGETFWASVSGRLIDYQGKEVVVSHTRDLTDQLAIEQELQRQREIVHQSEKLSALGELLAGVAHELNNPLSVVVGQALLLKETATDKKVMARAEKIGSAADRCARIVKTFLAMARQQPSRTENILINEVIEAAMEVVGYSIRSSDVDVSLQLGRDLPAIWGDPDQLGQVMSNLLINAQQALADHDGRRKIKIATRYDRRQNNVIIKISDTGPGIPESIRSRIFEPFFTTKEVGTGTGIGLAFCHRILETHGGAIRVESEPGRGTAFFIKLPASDRPQQALTDEVQTTTTDDAFTILVIDDEPDVADLITEILTSDGHHVVTAESGSQALREIARQEFSMILSDLNMPGLDGASLFEKLRNHHPQLIARIAFVTGDTMSPKAREFLDSASRPYLEKPIRPAELRKLVAQLS